MPNRHLKIRLVSIERERERKNNIYFYYRLPNFYFKWSIFFRLKNQNTTGIVNIVHFIESLFIVSKFYISK